ncbi:MAG: ADOP family duplicated permease [Acidobacteriota bacterium]
MDTPQGLQALVADGRYALRSVRKDLKLFSLAVLIIGIGVGACTAVFSILSPLIVRPLPFEEPDRLVWIANGDEGQGMSSVTSRTSNLRDFRELSRSFDGLTGYFAFFEFRSHNLIGTGEPEPLVGVDVAGNFLDVLGVEILHGRNFVDEESVWGGRNAIILTHQLWQRRFDSDPAIVGQAVTLGQEPYDVVGVLPESFDFASTFVPQSQVDFLLPFPISDETDAWGNTISMIGRLSPGASVESAQADLDGVIAGLQDADPERWGLDAKVTGLQRHISGPFQSAGLLLGAAALVVMLIVCVNLSNLLLARSSKRSAEMAVRSALGASRPRLIRQLLLESLFLSLAGAAAGLAVAYVAVRGIASHPALEIPLLASASLDGLALAVAAGLALCASLVVGGLPAWMVTRREASVVRQSGRGLTGGRGGARLRELMVVAEVALACLLLVCGGLLIKSFYNVLSVEMGYQPERVVSWKLSPTRGFENSAEQTAYFTQLAERVAAIGAVDAAGLTDAAPLGRNRTWNFQAPGQEYDGESSLGTFVHLVDHRYLETLEISLLRGRHFTAADSADGAPVVILNASAAAAVFNGEDALGRTIQVGQGEVQVVGVVADIRHRSPEDGSGLQAYLPITQVPDFTSLELVVRSSLPPDSLAPAVSEALRELDPTLPTREYVALGAVFERTTSPRRLTVQILTGFAGVAVLLAVLGIYGVLSCVVEERVREFGIRMALGETAQAVMGRVLSKSMLLVVAGLAVGLGGAFLGSRWLGSLLYGVESTDPATFGAMAGLMLVVGALAGLLPARRAAGTDLSVVLRDS